jgi:leucyl-tRNA synthetase
MADDKEKTGIELKGVKAINPANGEEIPVWIADFILVQYGTGAVFADMHDERDFLFAKKYNLPLKQSIMPYTFDVKSPPIKGKKDTKREVVHVILRNPRNKTILVEYLKHESWGDVKPKNFIIGGIEENETEIESAVREIKEETGYTNVKFIQKIPLEVQAEFYNPYKDVNRIVHVHTLIFDLIDETQVEISEEEKTLHDIKWIPESDVANIITIPDEKMVWKYFYEGEFAFTDDGILINSGKFNGLTSAEARKKITEFVEGKIVTKYKLRDWVFSRQRYWGEPIPIVYCEKCGFVPVPEKDLPVLLPKVAKYKPADNGESPLALIKSWVNTKCPNCKGKAKRETDTMPNWAGSSWYFLRYTDSKNKKEFASPKALKYWMKEGVDWYNGGMEHTTLHLLYSRFWHKFLYDLKLVPTSEPYMKRTSHGMILAEGGVKMSKSIGNTIDPKDIVNIYGADTLRIYEMFMGPFDQAVSWSTESIIGSRRFLDKVWRIGERIVTSQIKTNSRRFTQRGEPYTTENLSLSASFQTLLHKTIKKIEEDIEGMSFNTAISSMMVLVNEMEKNEISISDFKKFLQILAPFAPHLTEELWQQLEKPKTKNQKVKSIHLSSWPKWDKNKIIDEKIVVAVQVNGKVRAEISIDKDMEEEEVKNLALKNKGVLSWIENKEIKRFIYIKGRIVNIVV